MTFETIRAECDQCGAQHCPCVCFEGGNGEVGGVATVCRVCLHNALKAFGDSVHIGGDLTPEELGGNVVCTCVTVHTMGAQFGRSVSPDCPIHCPRTNTIPSP